MVEYSKSCMPKEIHKGLDVCFIDDSNDFFMMTSLDLRFAVPDVDPPLEGNVLAIIHNIFHAYLRQSRYGSSIISFYHIKGSAVEINLSDYLNEGEGLSLVTDFCRMFLDFAENEKDSSELIRKYPSTFKKASAVLTDYLDLITNRGGYTYREEYK